MALMVILRCLMVVPPYRSSKSISSHHAYISHSPNFSCPSHLMICPTKAGYTGHSIMSSNEGVAPFCGPPSSLFGFVQTNGTLKSVIANGLQVPACQELAVTWTVGGVCSFRLLSMNTVGFADGSFFVLLASTL